MSREIGLADAKAEFGCHLAELSQRGDLYGAERHGYGSFRCQQVVAGGPIVIDDRRLASHLSAQNTVLRLELAPGRAMAIWPTGPQLFRPQRGAARLWEPERFE